MPEGCCAQQGVTGSEVPCCEFEERPDSHWHSALRDAYREDAHYCIDAPEIIPWKHIAMMGGVEIQGYKLREIVFQ
jgi:hypothetical protein